MPAPFQTRRPPRGPLETILAHATVAVDGSAHAVPSRREVSSALFASATGRNATGFRLEFVLRTGERVPATSWYFSLYRERDRRRTLDAINRALGTRANMIV